jgi:putative ABC transport system ATP-binding protein
MSDGPSRQASVEPLIRLTGVTKVYGSGQAAMHALRGIDLAIDAGEFVAVMGPSGSGKSTVMNILGCLDTPSGGSYAFRGIDVGALDRNQRALVYRGVPAAERHARAREACAVVGLSGWEHHTPAELSGGQQQRVAIARAIVTRPEVLLADEPTGNLDTARSQEIMELLGGFNRDAGITIVMVTHDATMASCARRIVRCIDGLIADDARNGVAA